MYRGITIDSIVGDRGSGVSFGAGVPIDPRSRWLWLACYDGVLQYSIHTCHMSHVM